ncbi:Uncharacterised protein [Vibrio cholerae]|nr:Uncharacterised protein [Vibrio cholerae]
MTNIGWHQVNQPTKGADPNSMLHKESLNHFHIDREMRLHHTNSA